MEESVPVDFIEDDDFQQMDDGTDDSECDESEYGYLKRNLNLNNIII